MENTLLNLIPAAYLPEIHLSQYDVGRTITFTLKDGASDYSVPSGASVKVKATKPSGFGFEVACTFNGGTVTLVTTDTMTPENGRFPAELSIVSGNTTIGTSNFIFNIERSPHPEGTIDGDAESLLPELTLLVERIEDSNARIESMTASATTLPTGEEATAEYDPTANRLVLGLPRGEKGERGDQGEGVATLEPRVLANENKIDVLRSRMDAFASLPEGSTTGDAELTDIRVGAIGETYPTAGDSVRGQVENLNKSVAIASNRETVIPFGDMVAGQIIVKNVFVPKGKIITITATTYNTGVRATFRYTDGTRISAIRVSDKLRYRAEKDIYAIDIYAGVATNATVTVTDEPLYLTNYYDKSAKVEGMINNSGVVVSGGYRCSDFIPIALGETLIASSYPSTFGSARVFFYDDEKNYVGRINGTAREDGLYSWALTLSLIGSTFANGNVYYARFNMPIAQSDISVFYKNEVPYDTVLYGQHLPKDREEFFNEVQKQYISNAGSQPIAGKKIAYNGDSIAESRLATGNTHNGGAYAKMIADLTGGTYSNIAHGGGILASAVPSGTMPHSVVNTLSNMPNDADLICFEGGINDYWRDVPLGDYTESDYTSTLDTTTICGALETIFRQAKQKWVGKPICFVITHKIKSTVYVPNSAGYTWTQVHEKLVGICKKYAIPFYDAFTDSGLNAYDDIQNTTFLTANSTGVGDGCHPNALGYEKYYVPQLIALFNSIMPR